MPAVVDAAVVRDRGRAAAAGLLRAAGRGSVPLESIGASTAASAPASATARGSPASAPKPAGPSVEAVAPMAARIRSGVAGRSWTQTPVASWIAATTAGAPTSIGSSPTPFAPCGAPLNGASTRIDVIRGASSEVGMMYVASRSLR